MAFATTGLGRLAVAGIVLSAFGSFAAHAQSPGPAPAVAERPIVLAQAPLGYAAPGPSPFDFLGAIFGARPQAPRYRLEPSAPSPQSATPRSGEGAAREPAASGVAVAYCVRTCDGRYFPLQGRPAGAGDSNAVTQCAAFCPAAKTQVFTSPDRDRGIDAAADQNGRAYSAMPNAFVFRERLVEGCSCTGSPQVGGLAHIDVARDPTLKRGDLVMTGSGLRVFAASERRRPPYRSPEFVAPSRFPEFSREMRQRIERLSVAAM